jgi:hypothetical protein
MRVVLGIIIVAVIVLMGTALGWIVGFAAITRADWMPTSGQCLLIGLGILFAGAAFCRGFKIDNQH